MLKYYSTIFIFHNFFFCSEDNKFMGCYSDSANERKLTGAKEQWPNTLTKVDCISHCFRLGYLYAGLEAG